MTKEELKDNRSELSQQSLLLHKHNENDSNICHNNTQKFIPFMI